MTTMTANTFTFDHNQSTKYNSDYYSDDQTSDVTVTTMKDSIKSIHEPVVTTHRESWLDEIEHSFDTHHYHTDDENEPQEEFYEPIIQPSFSNPQPTSIHSNIPVHQSKFALMKSRMKRVFRKKNDSSKKALPVISSLDRWSPSIDSSTSTFKDTASTCSTKYSCGFSTASFNKSSHKQTVIALAPEQEGVKSILKKNPQTRPKKSGGIDEQKRKRWSRISIMAVPSKRLSVIVLKRKTELFEKEKKSNSKIRFEKYVHVHETYAGADYDRSSDPDAVCTRLTANIAQQIKQELNHFKLHEMSVHDSSRIHTHFFL